jgi:hypothetical protein
VFSGTPFAANPQSGWTYLPAMVIFALLPLASAAKLYALVHPWLAACGAFALARVLGLSRAGALLTAVAYANTSFVQVQNVSSSPFSSVYAWLPVALLGVELAIRSTVSHTRFTAWGLAALAMSQIVAAWPGQGAYYAAMLVGGYIAFRTLLVIPGRSSRSLARRAGDLLTHAAVVFMLGAALDAAAILPRLEFNGLSNLAGGYSAEEAVVGGLHPKDWVLLAVPGFWYAGASVLVLTVAAAFLGRAPLRASLGFFGITSIAALLLSGTVETPFHWLLYHLLPGFARLHPHAPERILTVAYLGPAVLAGAAVSAMQRRGWLLRGPFTSWVLVLLVTADLAVGGAKARGDVMLQDPLHGVEKLTPVHLASYVEPDAAELFLHQRLAETLNRYVGYAPYLNGKAWPYSIRFADLATASLSVNNRALSVGLQDAQGYDAIHLGRYDEYFAIMNGRTQNYHDAEVFRAGLGSPLLDLLNVRYVIAPPADDLDLSDRTALLRFPSLVFSTSRVRILENPNALPRAWLVHAAAQMAPAEALQAIDSGRVQARDTALLEELPPTLAAPADASRDQARVTDNEADRVVVTSVTDAAGMLVLSEVYYPAWNAYLDGQPARLYVADGALSAVAVPAGEHTIELRFESATLVAGIAVSVGTIVLMATLLLVSLVRPR